eukprot:TRINITY_DN11683_c1_g1_i1.p1 TRINITY_DN11683_c1_g1~~TRINITY_DN11683_c1_g1_i1.p1  ORF type:complete len:307 (-),score=45.70 TRINITY_DN11683_c1_g1_i1:282-1202(-)
MTETTVYVEINRLGSSKLGLDVDHADGKSLFVERISAGAVGAHNSNTANLVVRSGDRVVGVNGVVGEAWILLNECKMETDLQLDMQRHREYSVVIKKSFGEKLGVDVDTADGTTLKVLEVTGGAVGKWNEANLRRDIRPGDKIVGINGVYESQARLLEECKKSSLMSLKIRREETFRVTLNRSPTLTLGVDVDVEKAPFALTVLAVKGGLVAAWNEACLKSIVRPADRIVQVNGISSNVNAMLEQCTHASVLQFVIQRTLKPKGGLGRGRDRGKGNGGKNRCGPSAHNVGHGGGHYRGRGGYNHVE